MKLFYEDTVTKIAESTRTFSLPVMGLLALFVVIRWPAPWLLDVLFVALVATYAEGLRIRSASLRVLASRLLEAESRLDRLEADAGSDQQLGEDS